MLCENTVVLATTIQTSAKYATLMDNNSAIRVVLSEFIIRHEFPERALEEIKFLSGRDSEPSMLEDAYALLSAPRNKVLLVELDRIHSMQEPMSQKYSLVFPIDIHKGKLHNRTSGIIKELFPLFYSKQCHAKDIIATFDKRPKFSIKRTSPQLKRFSNEKFKQRMA